MECKSDGPNGRRYLRTLKSPVASSPPTSRPYAQLRDYFQKMGNRAVEVLTVSDDSGCDFEEKKVSKSKYDRLEIAMARTRASISGVKEMISNFLTIAVNMFSGNAASGDGSRRLGILNNLRGIAKLYITEGIYRKTDEKVAN